MGAHPTVWRCGVCDRLGLRLEFCFLPSHVTRVHCEVSVSSSAHAPEIISRRERVTTHFRNLKEARGHAITTVWDIVVNQPREL